MTGAHGYALVVQDGRHIVRMNAVENERQHAGVLRRRPEPAEAVNSREPCGRARQQVLFVRRDVLHPNGLDVIDRRPKARYAGKVWRPRCELLPAARARRAKLSATRLKHCPYRQCATSRAGLLNTYNAVRPNRSRTWALRNMNAEAAVATATVPRMKAKRT